MKKMTGTEADTFKTSYYVIRSRLNNLRLDVEGGRKTAGARVTPWLAKSWSDQLWYDFKETGTIVWKRTRLCIELKDDTIILNDYSHGNTNQLWRRDGAFIRHALNPSLVISVSEESLTPGSKVTAQPFRGGLNQQFDFLHVPGLDDPNVRRNFFIVSELSQKVLDIRRERTSPGTEVIAWPKKSSPSKNQLWYFDKQGIIRSCLNDFAIETQQGSTAKIMPCDRKPSQEWTLVENGIMSRTGECLECQGNDGSQVNSGKFYDTPNQRWWLEFL